MFQFTGFPSIRYGLAYGYMRFAHVGFPIQRSRINGYLLLPEAFRSLSRLSSALSAKASTLRSSSLNLHIHSVVYAVGLCLRVFSRVTFVTLLLAFYKFKSL